MYFMALTVQEKLQYWKQSICLQQGGRSAPTYLKNYIQYSAEDAIVFAQSATEKIGMQKLASGEQLMKVNGDTVATQGQLAKLLPFAAY